MSLEHAKNAVITGAASGIGRAIALALADRRYKVGIADLDLDAAREALRMVESRGGSGEARRCDVGDPSQVEAMAEHFFEQWGQVGLLVNNAGIGGGGYVGETSLADWEAVFRTNFWGVLHGCHAFIPRMKAQPGGAHIINTASTAGLVAVMGFAPYNTSKAAVVALSETLVVELAPFDIGVTVLCPTMVKTNILENSLAVISADKYESMEWGMELIITGLENCRITVDDVARMALDAAANDRLFVVTNAPNRSNWRYARLTPERYYRGIAYLNKKGLARRFIMSVARKGNA